MGLTKIMKIIYIFILVIVGGFASEVKAYYASTFEHDVAIEVTSYEDLTFEFDQVIYGNNVPINIIVNNPNPYAVSYTFVFDNDVTYQVDGSSVASYIVEANSAKTNVIVVSGASRSNLEININATSPYTESYTETIALDVEAPVGSVTSTNNQASSQTVTLNMTDNVGVNAYYFGTKASPSESDYTEIEATTLAIVNETVSNNGTYYLFVKDASENTFNTSAEFYKVILEPTGGSVSPTSIVAKSGNKITLPTPTNSDGSAFLSWNTASDGSGTEYTTNYTGSGNGSTTLYAQWVKDSELPSATITSTNNQASSQTVTLNMTDNIGVSAYYFGTNSNPSASDYTEIEATTLAVINETVDNNGIYYLFVKDASRNTFNTSVEFYKVILDPTGGSLSPTSIVAMSGNEISLPTPSSSSKEFIEWNTASDGSGTEYTTSYTGSGNGSTTLYAMWQAKPTLYSVLANEATSGSGLAQTYTGAHQDSYAGTGTESIYYYNATSDANATTILDKNNVIFAGFCWQMIRTTDTGGVKIIYNGEAVDGQCLNTRATHVGYGYQTSTSLSSTYYYGTSYSYNGSTFSLAGETKSAKWSDSTYQDLIGWYTCRSSSETGTCSTLYYVESYYTSSSAYALPLKSGVHYSTIGKVQFNANYKSPSYVGYMYNKVYPNVSKYDDDFETQVSMLSRNLLSTNYYYAEEVVYGSPTASRYNLVSPYKVTSTSEYSSLVGKYTFMNSTETYTSSGVYYIADVDGSYMYYISLSSGKSLVDVDTSYMFGDSYEDNGDGTYTLTNPVTLKKSEWYDNYESMKGKYTCNSASATCSNPLYVSSTSTYQYMYLENPANNYKYANSFTYENGKYYLSGTEQTFFDWSSNYNKLSNTHYTCWNTSGECDEISYIYYSGITGTIGARYINIAGGKGVEEALEEILSVNTTNSTIKSVIDEWYKNNLLSYSSYLEDTVFCNDRSIRSLGGWNPNGGSTTGTSSYLHFKEYNVTSDLSCSNETDRFSVSNSKAQLTYPVGLATSPEMKLLGNGTLPSGEEYWLASPYSFDGDANGRYASETGSSGRSSVDTDRGVRPSVSLAPGTEYEDGGDGSMSNPYVVKMNE